MFVQNNHTCSICKSKGTNLTTCPLNLNATGRTSFKKHYLAGIEQQQGGIFMSTVPIVVSAASGPRKQIMVRKFNQLRPIGNLNTKKNTKTMPQSKKYNVAVLKTTLDKIFTKIIPKLIVCNNYTGSIKNSTDFINIMNEENKKYSKIFTDPLSTITSGNNKQQRDIINALKQKYGNNVSLSTIMKQINTNFNTIDDFNKEFVNYYYLISFIASYISFLLTNFYSIIVERSNKSGEAYDYTKKTYCGMMVMKIVKELKKELNNMQKIIGFNGSKSTDVQQYVNNLILDFDSLLDLYKQIKKNIRHNSIFRFYDEYNK
jgi:hypothetical protein